MRVVLDTNVLISALLLETSAPAALVTLWRRGYFTLLTAEEQLDELARVTRYPKIRERIAPALAGRLVNDLRDIAELVDKLPAVEASPDPYDNYLLAIAEAAAANFLVTGDKADLLTLKKHKTTAIVSVTAFMRRLKKT